MKKQELDLPLRLFVCIIAGMKCFTINKKLSNNGINFQNKENFIGVYLLPAEYRINSYSAYNQQNAVKTVMCTGFIKQPKYMAFFSFCIVKTIIFKVIVR